MGARGPAPKRSTQRRRRNTSEGTKTTSAPGAPAVEAPKPNSKWHPIVKRWFTALGESGQSAFYEPSDWAMAEVIAESMSRDLKPKPIGVDDDGKPITVHMPISGQALAAYLKGMTGLLVSEVDRRRAGIELTRPAPAGDEGEEGDGSVSELDEWRDRLNGGAAG